MTAKNDISQRFLEAFNEILRLGLTTDKRDFASKIGISSSMMTEISKGRSSVGVSAIQNIVSQFNIESNWLLTGEGEMLRSVDHGADKAHESVASEPIGVYSATPQADYTPFIQLIKEKDAKIEELSKEIGRLEEVIRQLTVEKAKHVSDASTERIAGVG